MVTDDLWGRYGSHRGCLCVGCLEDRMGRKLKHTNFIDVPLNTDQGRHRSERLKDRLQSPQVNSTPKPERTHHK
jgi:hypothetical protein